MVESESNNLTWFTMKRRWRGGYSPANSLFIGNTEEKWRSWKNWTCYRKEHRIVQNPYGM